MKRNKWNLICFIIIVIMAILVLGCSKRKSQIEETNQGIHWMEDMDMAMKLAQENKMPLMIDFMATWCPPCNQMEDSTFVHPDVIDKAGSFITVRIDVDKQCDVANAWNCNAGKYGGIGIPNILFLDPEGNELKHPIGYRGPEDFLAIMDSALVMIKSE